MEIEKQKKCHPDLSRRSSKSEGGIPGWGEEPVKKAMPKAFHNYELRTKN
jgi:hypothetical protein